MLVCQGGSSFAIFSQDRELAVPRGLYFSLHRVCEMTVRIHNLSVFDKVRWGGIRIQYIAIDCNTMGYLQIGVRTTTPYVDSGT